MMSAMNDTRRAPLTIERLRALLDAYGASPDRWPPDEREPALALLAQSTEAQALQVEAARLDALLDLVPARQPSPELVACALAGAPRGRSLHRRPGARRWQMAAAALPLAAAAAAAVIWLLPQREPAPTQPVQYAIEDLGVYTTPTDVLLEPPGFDVSRTAPVVGCVNNGLACPIPDAPAERQSLSGRHRRQYV